MADFSPQDMDRLIAEITKVSGSMDGYVKSLMQNQKSSTKAKDTFNSRVKNFDEKMWAAARTVEHFSKGMDHAAQAVAKTLLTSLGPKTFVGLTLLGTITTALWKTGSDLNKTWRDMADIGQTFGGSMFAMQQAANAAGVPLDTFAKLQSQHNVTISAMGTAYWQVNKQLRQNLRVSGMYGMSMEQLGDFTAQYLEVSRLNGTAQSKSNSQLVKEFSGLASETTALAAASDKTREEITKLATSALSGALAIDGIRGLPAGIQNEVDKSVKVIATGFAALPGQAGEFLSKMFGDSLGGSVTLSEGGQSAVEAGLSNLASAFDALATRTKNGAGKGIDDVIAMNNTIIQEVDSNRSMLNAQILNGNQAARQWVEMASKLKTMTRAQIEQDMKRNERAEKLTAFFASIESIFADLKSTFGESFIKSFSAVFKGLDEISGNGALDALKKFLVNFGSLLGNLLGSALTEANITKLGQGILNITEGLFKLFAVVAGSTAVWTVLGSTVKFLAGTLGFVVSIFNKLGHAGQQFVGGLIGAILIFNGMKRLFGGIGGLFSRMFRKNMVVNAANVTVNGGLGGGVLGAAEGAAETAIGTGGKGKGLLGGLKGGIAGLLAARKTGGLKGMLGAAKGIRGLGGLATGLGIGLLGIGGEYAADKLSDNGYGKSATALGMASNALTYGATGAAIGSFIPGVGNIAGGLIGGAYGAYSAYSDYSSRSAHTAAVAATTAAMMKDSDNGDDTTPDSSAPDPMQSLLDEIKGLRQDLRIGDGQMLGKMETANRLLSKIEVSTQVL